MEPVGCPEARRGALGSKLDTPTARPQRRARRAVAPIRHVCGNRRRAPPHWDYAALGRIGQGVELRGARAKLKQAQRAEAGFGD